MVVVFPLPETALGEQHPRLVILFLLHGPHLFPLFTRLVNARGVGLMVTPGSREVVLPAAVVPVGMQHILEHILVTGFHRHRGTTVGVVLVGDVRTDVLQVVTHFGGRTDVFPAFTTFFPLGGAYVQVVLGEDVYTRVDNAFADFRGVVLLETALDILLAGDIELLNILLHGEVGLVAVTALTT